ncbi:hypothetical protein NL108_015870 [Boleophthalmus pectinirostris]|nr:hypothetical protein NL108_015870 [Boleophthalmus pectinirostris]
MEVEAGAEEDDGDDAPEEEEEEEEEEDEEDEEEEEEPAAMTTSPHSNNSITHNSNNNHISHNNTVAHNNSVSHGNTQTDGVVQQRVQRRASAPAVTSTFRPAPSQWSVEEVTAFINTLPGCGDVAEAFRVQEIDGQALLLLTEDHLMTSMNIKLGPALKICAHINSLKNQ